jgi:hypothetical protein
VEQSVAETIRGLYRRASLRVGGVDLTVPNWLFQVLGLTARDIRCTGDRLTFPYGGTSLVVQRRDDDLTQVGSALYRHAPRALNLGTLLTVPRLWLGNPALAELVPLDVATRAGRGRADGRIEWAGQAEAYAATDEDRRALERLGGRPDPDLADLDLAARMLGAAEADDALAAIELLRELVGQEEGPLKEIAGTILARSVESAHPTVRRRALQVLVPVEIETRFPDLLRRFVTRDPQVLDADSRAALCERTLGREQVAAFVELARRACAGEVEEEARGPLLDFLAAYGTAHPASYRPLRAFLERMALLAVRAPARAAARRAQIALESGFREWLGPSSRVAVDPETGQEYRWDEVVVFGEDVPPADRARLRAAIEQTALLREGVFLFSGGVSVRLSDVPPGGVWIRLLGSRHGKSVYRVTVQTRFQGSYDLAVNVNHDLTREQVEEEVRWLILSGDPSNRDPLVEDFGGFWPEHGLWSEEFIEGETLDRAMSRMGRRADGGERLVRAWPFFAWATLAAYADFWNRSGGRLELADPSRTNVIVPLEDYQFGVRIVSLSRRRQHRGLLEMMRAFHDEFVAPAEAEYPTLRGVVGWPTVFSSLLEVVGEREGSSRLREARARIAPEAEGELESQLAAFLDRCDECGFVPLRLHFAIERYRRWAALSGEPTPQARALTLSELYDTYALRRLEEHYPEIRVRFFLETVFRDSPALAAGLGSIIRSMRQGELGPEELIHAVDALRAGTAPRADEVYFLARVSYPYLRPEDAANFVQADSGGQRHSEIVVTLEDQDGRPFRVRHVLNPREVERLLQLFHSVKLDVRFRPEHHYLVAINERGHLIAGIYYEMDEESRSAHLEKIVVAERYRRRGVADGLMNEFFNRLRAAGMKTVTTGFFRPEYFYAYGFRIEKRYAGLVKTLEEEG